jgi:hypothetical protein
MKSVLAVFELVYNIPAPLYIPKFHYHDHELATGLSSYEFIIHHHAIFLYDPF